MKHLLPIICILLFCTATNIYGQKIKFKKISSKDYKKESCEYYEDADAEYLYNSCKVYVNYNSSKNEVSYNYEYHYRIKIYNEEAYSEADRTIYLYTPEDSKKDSDKIRKLEAYTFNQKNGSEVKLKLEKDKVFENRINKYYSTVKFAMPAISEGSIIDVRYTINVNRVGSIREFDFQKDLPVKTAYYSVETPTEYVYNKKIKGLIPLEHNSKYLVSSGLKVNVDEYKGEKIPPLQREPFTLTMENYRSTISLELNKIKRENQIDIDYTKTWNDIAKLLHEDFSFGAQLEKKIRFYDEFIKGLNNKNDDAKIQAIYNEVQQNYTWNGYYGIWAENGLYDLYEKKTGNLADINLLLVNLLNKAGIPAKPMVFQRRSSGFMNHTYPTINELNYVIASVEKDDGSFIYLDGSNKHLSINELPEEAINFRAIVIDGKEAHPIELVNYNKGNTQEVVSLSIENKELVGEYKMRSNGYDAFKVRDKYLTESDYIKSFKGDTYTLSDLSVKDFNSKEMIEFSAKVKSNKDIQEIDNKLFINVLPIIGNVENPFKTESRDFAIFFDYTFRENMTILIDIPEGYKVESLPESLSIATEDGSVTENFTVRIAGDKIMVSSNLAVPNTIISPTYYISAKAVFEKLEAKTKEKIVLAKM